MIAKRIYLFAAMAGLIVPWVFLFGFVSDQDAGVSLFFRSLFANPVAGAVSADLLISALVFFLFVYCEGRRLMMRRLWVYPVITLGIGL
ncbi:MAG: DUF2834 domain-containing protein, partial [Gammaproteobacteria bacterium]|nr:DUF2834 domain-containing protein [Gammaproteobacteria bacterium]